MKERSIICRDDEVRAFLEGRKTQLRRPLAGPDTTDIRFDAESAEWYCEGGLWHARCPFGIAGDRLCVREAFATVPWKAGAEKHVPENDHDEQGVRYRATWDRSHSKSWRPSSQMPRWASRVTLELVSVRVERLQDITTQDAISEGVKRVDLGHGVLSDARCAFRDAWGHVYGESVDAKTGESNAAKHSFAWVNNPLVWALETKVIA